MLMKGGGKTQVTQSSANTVTVAASPVVAVNTGPGAASPSGAGGASGSASAPASPTFSATESMGGYGFGAHRGTPLPSYPTSDVDVLPAASGGLFGGLLGDDATLWIIVGLGALYVLTQTKGG